jgi:NAD(P)-dependent dehydrogenase (short-subunit alcohol dehydrogenase family)
MPIALVTGAGSLLGIGIAEALVNDGWQVVLTDINPTNATEAAERLGADNARALVLDVTDTQAVRALVAEVTEKDGAIVGLVNAAGGLGGLGFGGKLFVDTTPDEWRKILDFNLFGMLNVSRAVLPGMIERRRGSIVSISSGAGLTGMPKAAVYSAAKAAIILFTKSVSLDCAPHEVRINAIAPGNVDATWKAGRNAVTLPPIGRAATGREVGDATSFLLSHRASHITGICLDVSGGATLH